jgi:hypothetical protein
LIEKSIETMKNNRRNFFKTFCEGRGVMGVPGTGNANDETNKQFQALKKYKTQIVLWS